MDFGFIIFVSVIGLILFAVGIFFLLKFLKGSIELKLDKNSFSSGENIVGSFELKTKKQITSRRLLVEIEAFRQERTYSNGRTSSTWRKIYSQEKNVEDAKTYPAGFHNNYQFDIKVPSRKDMGGAEIKNDVLNSVVKLASAVGGFGRLRWNLKVRLDTKGVDLTKKKRIHVNLVDSDELQNPSTI